MSQLPHLGPAQMRSTLYTTLYMGLHQNLAARGGMYGKWHRLPYATVMHFLVLTVVLSAVALHLQSKLLERMDDFTTGTISLDNLPS